VKSAGLATFILALTCAPVTTGAGPSQAGLTIQKTAQRLVVRGDVSSQAHAAILRNTAADLFASHEAIFELRPSTDAPPGWSLVTDMTLRAMAETVSSIATIDPGLVEIRAITQSGSHWPDAVSQVGSALLPNMRLAQESSEIGSSASLETLCRRQFDAAVRGQTVRFAISSSALPSNIYPMLDAVAEIATDCPRVRITVLGHTDRSGDEHANLALSHARATAVVGYLRDRGIAEQRLAARGMGSSQPIVDDSSLSSRRRNRRIEFSFESR
jgi:OOP family OmpA-OmpF porin